MLFRRTIEKSCVYCERGTELMDGQILCTKKGIRQSQNKCWRFRYDPCKRIPVRPKALDFSKYDQEDYTL